MNGHDATAGEADAAWRHSLDCHTFDPVARSDDGTDDNVCDSAQNDLLRDFLEHWDDELQHEDALAACPPSHQNESTQSHESEPATPGPQLAVDSPHSSRESRAAAGVPGANGVAPATPAASVVRKRKRRKFEVMQLREEVKALEQHHLTLHEHLLKQAGPVHQLSGVLLLGNGDHTVANDDGALSSLVVARARRQPWNAIAHRELELRSAAELRNHELKAEYQHQRKVATQLQRLLQKTAAAASVSLDSVLLLSHS